MNSNDTQYAEYFASMEEMCLKGGLVETFLNDNDELEHKYISPEEIYMKPEKKSTPKAKTEQEKMAEYSFNELTK